MLCFDAAGLRQPCAVTIGGVGRLWVYDAEDFNFTEGTTAANGDPTGYASVNRRVFGSGATATATVTSGGVTAIAVGAGGTLYTQNPTISFTGSGGTGATAVAVRSNGVITAINVTAPGTGYTTAPTVVITPAGATAAGGAFFYPIDSIGDTIGVDITQSNPNRYSPTYAYQIVAQIGAMSQTMTNFLKKLDAAAACCQIGFAWITTSNKIFLAGEKYINNQETIGFRMFQDGTVLHTGKVGTDFNGADFSVRGSFLRAPYEFTGGLSVISALQPVV